MELIGITEAKDKLSSLVERLERATIIKNNAPVAVLVPMADYRVLERMELLLQDPPELRRILERHQAVLEGRHEEYVELDELRASQEKEARVQGEARAATEEARRAAAAPAAGPGRRQPRRRAGTGEPA